MAPEGNELWYTSAYYTLRDNSRVKRAGQPLPPTSPPRLGFPVGSLWTWGGSSNLVPS
jgi:hypothetical protein